MHKELFSIMRQKMFFQHRRRIIKCSISKIGGFLSSSAYQHKKKKKEQHSLRKLITDGYIQQYREGPEEEGVFHLIAIPLKFSDALQGRRSVDFHQSQFLVSADSPAKPHPTFTVNESGQDGSSSRKACRIPLLWFGRDDWVGWGWGRGWVGGLGAGWVPKITVWASVVKIGPFSNSSRRWEVTTFLPSTWCTTVHLLLCTKIVYILLRGNAITYGLPHAQFCALLFVLDCTSLSSFYMLNRAPCSLRLTSSFPLHARMRTPFSMLDSVPSPLHTSVCFLLCAQPCTSS